TSTTNGTDKPVFLKNDLQDQIPMIKKGNLKHQDYAKKTIQELFNGEVLKNATVKEFNYSSSCVAINKGNGNFEIQKLPLRAQLSCVNAIKCMDVNNDGFTDIITAGNNAGFLPQLEKLDASYGDVFINNRKGGFTWMGPKNSGLKIDGEVRDIAALKGKNKTYLLFLRNNDYPKTYQLKSPLH
ncbi:MAG: CRTAC1 family protein, partial [Segetibacter sp.]